MKQGVSTKAQVLALRRGHSLREVAAQTGLPLGTIKTWCARSGAFKDNPQHRALFALPPIQTSTSTALTIQELPAQSVVTGDKEIDAVLWLRQVIQTGQADLIEKAKLAAKRIKTPLKELETRYLAHLTARNPGNWTVAFQTFGFADLDGLAHGATKKLTRKNEALARFGSVDNLFTKTPAEVFCEDALRGLTRKKDAWELDHDEVDQRFHAHPDLMPNTLSDCLFERAYWTDLYWLRSAADKDAGDHHAEVQARDDFIFRTMARIRPKTKQEAIAVFHYMADDHMDMPETEAILLNLIG